MTKKKNKIPDFRTLAEEAAFWDTHDTTDFEADFEEVDVEFELPLLKRGLTITLDEPYLSQLKDLAAQQQSNAASLAKEWLLERLSVTKI